MASSLVVSRIGYYRFAQGKASCHQQSDHFLQGRIAMIFTQTRETYDSPRIHAVLQAQGELVSLKRVARLMQAQHFIAKKRRRFKATTKVDKRPVKYRLDFAYLFGCYAATLTGVSAGLLYCAVVANYKIAAHQS
jgi:hypothetical protein